MKCKCGNEIDLKIGSKVVSKGCEVLTAMTMIATIKCSKCGAMSQVPISNDVKFEKNDR